ncbi:MAG: hypothetical protein AB8E82_07335 [Aureispira sp.]
MFWLSIALITISSSYFALQRERLKQENKSFLGSNNKHSEREIRQLKEENALLEKRINNLEHIVLDRKEYIDIEYELEQKRVDQEQQKFRY